MISHRIYRESCIECDGNFIKDLRILNRRLEDLIIIDNSIISFMNQLDNGIPIKEFKGDSSDRELPNLVLFLKSIKSASDVRVPIKEKYCLSKLMSSLKVK
jgi:TFIIF-interacting CTD phosphatase-like protein